MLMSAVSSGPGVASSVIAVVTLLAALFTAMASKPPLPVIAPKVMMRFSDPSAKRSSIVAKVKVTLLLLAGMVTFAIPVKSTPLLAVPL